jgi:hypothetical protein
MTPKEEWLKHCGTSWHYTHDDRWYRNKIAGLFDLEKPTEAQQHLLAMTSIYLTCGDLPSSEQMAQEDALRALVRKEFGPPPSERGWRWWRSVILDLFR